MKNRKYPIILIFVLVLFLINTAQANVFNIQKDLNKEFYSYDYSFYQSDLFNNHQSESVFNPDIQSEYLNAEYNNNMIHTSGRIYPNVLHDAQILSEPVDPSATLLLGKELVIGTDDDLLFHGTSSGHNEYFLGIYNTNDLSDTILRNLEFDMSANDIDPDGIYWWSEYYSYDGSSISWVFPPEFAIGEDDFLDVGFRSTTVEADHLNVDLFRSMNVTEFYADGNQLLQFTVTFKDKNFNWAWGQIDVWNQYEVEPIIISASGPTEVLNEFWVEDDLVRFAFDYNAIQVDTPYTFTVEIFVDLTDNVPPPIEFKPLCAIWLNKDDISINDGQSYTANMPEPLLFDNIDAASGSTNVYNTWIFEKHYYVVGLLDGGAEPIGPRAEYQIGKMLTVRTYEDSILAGPFTGFNRYSFNINNWEDPSGTELSNLEFQVDANNIEGNEIWWEEYSSLDGSLLSWDFPPEFVIFENDGFDVGYDSTEIEDSYLDMDISRSMNITDFYTDGYQMAQFTVTFRNKNFDWALAWIDIWNQYEVEPRIVSASGPLDVMYEFWFDEENMHFDFDYERIEIDTPYTFTVIFYVNLTDNAAPPVRFKPRFEVFVNKDYNGINGGQSYTADMPETLLFDNINAASATTDTFNIWKYSNSSHISAILEQEIMPVGPRADFVFEKNFGIHSYSDVLLTGPYSENLWYTLYMENTEDATNTVMGDLEFHAYSLDTIRYVDWEGYANWDSNQVDWYFPSPDFTLYNYDRLFTGFATDYAETRNLNMDMSRSFNKSIFDSDGHQLATFSVTFKDNDMLNVWGSIQVFNFADVNLQLIPETLITDAPIDGFGSFDSQRIEFGINPEEIVPDTEYTFSVVTEIDLPPAMEGTGINVTFKPHFGIGLNIEEIRDNGGEGFSTSMPEHMLRDNVTSVSASNNISNIWTLISRNQTIANLGQVEDVDSIRLIDLIITPTDSISVNNPAYVSAEITGINLRDVGFVVLEPESGIAPVWKFMDHVGGDQYEGVWDAKEYYVKDGATTALPVSTLIFPQGMILPDEEAFLVMGFVRINESTGDQVSYAIFNDTQLVDLWNEEDISIFEQIEYETTVFTPWNLIAGIGPQPSEYELTINQDFNIHEYLAPNIPFDIVILANDDYHGDGDFSSNPITVTVENEHQPVIYIDPDYQTKYPGSNFIVDINVDPQTHEIYSGQYDVYFDPAKLEAVNQIQGNFLSQDGASTIIMDDAIDNINGVVSYAETRFGVPTGVTIPGTMASIEFHVKDPVPSYGETALDLTNIILVDPQVQPIPNVVVIDGIVNIPDNQPPVADAGPDILSFENTGTAVSFDGSGSYDPDGNIAAYDWDFGDGNVGSGATPTHIYSSADYDGYTVTLTVTDNDGASDSDTATVVIYIAGDANGDRVVNILDAALVGIHWAETVNNPNFSPGADLNNDNVINILDAALIGIHWGDTGE